MLRRGRRIGAIAIAGCWAAGLAPAAGAAAETPDGGTGDPGQEATGGPEPLVVQSARTGQRGTHIVTRLRLIGYPAELRGTDLCLELFRSWTRTPTSRLCLVGATRSPNVRRERFNAAGRLTDRRRVPAQTRFLARTLELRVRLDRASIRPGGHRWRLISDRGGATSAYPRRHAGLLRVRRPRPVGCTPSGPSMVSQGSRSHRRVALTFDDGPGPHTRHVLDILRRHRARATFFVLGQEVGGRAAVLRRALRERHEIGNHTYRHELLPAASSVIAANRAVRRATGFVPCRFRPPQGLMTAGLASTVRRLGMTSVAWDVDPSDYLNPPAPTIASRVLGSVRPGSIVTLHDGGGNRARTVAALPAILRGLRRRGYRAVTVSSLLGGAVRYAP